jgi:excisionase family DNA binding protein
MASTCSILHSIHLRKVFERLVANMQVEVLTYSPVEAAQAIGVSESKVQQLLRDGELPSFLIGRRRRIHRDAVRDFLARYAEASAATR